MNGNIYIIKNSVNDKVYIGQTIQSLQKRFTSHKSAARNGQVNKLYNAMRKYGVDNFSIHLLEDNIKNENLDYAEVYYISYYNSYHNGYNSTIGGEGTSFYNFSDNEKLDIGIMYEKYMTMTPICEKYEVSRSVVYNILIDLRVDVKRHKFDSDDILIYFLETKSFSKTINYFNISKAQLIYYLKKEKISSIKNTVDYDLIDEVIINSFDCATVSEMAIMANCSRTVIQNRKNDFGLVKVIDEDGIKLDFTLGLSKSKIAKKYNCSKYKVNKVTNEIKDNANNKYFKRNEVIKVINCNYNLSNKELAAKANCSTKTIYRIKKELAI